MAKLRPRARIIRTIGDQLISGPEAAIIELVKNSYDADATKVEIRFKFLKGKELSILVSDNGHGMTYEELSGSWFEPATDTKVENPYSREKRRKLLGAKGIGRFAVSRLGQVSTVSSIARSTDSGELQLTSVTIDWAQFTAEKYLEDIDIEITCSSQNVEPPTGVQIRITNLRDKWTKTQLEKLIIELRRLVQPRSEDKFQILLDLTCFNQLNSGFSGDNLLEENNQDIAEWGFEPKDKGEIRPYRIEKLADYKVEGHFNQRGDFTGTFTIQRGDGAAQSLEIPAIPLREDEDDCGVVFMRFNIFDREHESIEKLFERVKLDFNKIGIRRARKILTDFSGISITRNDFRIRPYGDPTHDWLELQAKRVQDPSKKLGSDQISGFLEIQDEATSGIIERSSREGLEINGSFNRLKSLVTNLLPHIEERRFEFREKVGLGRRPSSNLIKARDAAKLSKISKAIDSIPEEFREKIEKAIAQDSSLLNSMLDEVDSYQKVLQSRAALGLVVAEVIHEGRRQLNPMTTAIRTLRSDWPSAFSDTKLGKIYREEFPRNIETLSNGSNGLSRLFKKLDPVSGRRRGRPLKFLVSPVVQDSIDLLSHAITERFIRIINLADPSLIAYGYKEDLQGGLLNILENAVHWLGVSDLGDRKIMITSADIGQKLLLRISNNGPTIDEAYQHRIFDVGFSLKSDGTGLGLAIAREACRASKGDIYFDIGAEITTFIIEFPKEE